MLLERGYLISRTYFFNTNRSGRLIWVADMALFPSPYPTPVGVSSPTFEPLPGGSFFARNLSGQPTGIVI
jgi:hypothetical protein